MPVHTLLGQPYFQPASSFPSLQPLHYTVLHVGSSSLKFMTPRRAQSHHSPSSMISQPSILISLHRRTTTTSILRFPRGRGRSKTISHISSVPWPHSPTHLPSLLSPDIRHPNPNGLGRYASIIWPVLPSFPVHFRNVPECTSERHPTQCRVIPNDTCIAGWLLYLTSQRS
ncbi:hypothetical protein EDB87DRAFT_1657806 [Lactarius vividus]|nr:hypothetical protein EDB87DRAFT_1657806 [Lactarius vividus]